MLEKTIGGSKVQPNYRITLIKRVREKLNLEIGDLVIYFENERGNIILKKGELRPV